MMEVLSKSWSGGLRTEDVGAATYSSRLSPLGGCLPGLPLPPQRCGCCVQTWRWPLPHPSFMPSFLALLAPFPGWAPRGQRAGRGDLCASPQRQRLLGSGPGRGADAQPPPLVLPCPVRNVSSEAHQIGGRFRFTEGAVSCHPSPLKPPLSGRGLRGGGQAGGMSQRPNVLRGGKAERPPGRTRPWDTWLFSTSAPSPGWPRRVPRSETVVAASSACLPCAKLFPKPGRQARED